MKKLFLSVACAALLTTAACASAPTPSTATGQIPTLTGLRPSINTSPMDLAYQCFGMATAQRETPLRISVGQVRDYTGKFSNEASEGGFRLTQGGALMVMSAIGKLPGVELVERFDLEIAGIERGLTTDSLIQDPVYDPNTGQPVSVRNLTAGQYQGSDYYIVGGLTEVNYAIRTGGVELGVSMFEAGKRYYVMNVAGDLRIVDSRTTRVVRTVSVQKQIIGEEVRAGVYRFFGDYLIDVNAGTKDQEPLQMGVRTALEYGVLELLSPLYNNRVADCQPQIDYAFRRS